MAKQFLSLTLSNVYEKGEYIQQLVDKHNENCKENLQANLHHKTEDTILNHSYALFVRKLGYYEPTKREVKLLSKIKFPVLTCDNNTRSSFLQVHSLYESVVLLVVVLLLQHAVTCSAVLCGYFHSISAFSQSAVASCCHGFLISTLLLGTSVMPPCLVPTIATCSNQSFKLSTTIELCALNYIPNSITGISALVLLMHSLEQCLLV